LEESLGWEGGHEGEPLGGEGGKGGSGLTVELVSGRLAIRVERFSVMERGKGGGER